MVLADQEGLCRQPYPQGVSLGKGFRCLIVHGLLPFVLYALQFFPVLGGQPAHELLHLLMAFF